MRDITDQIGWILVTALILLAITIALPIKYAGKVMQDERILPIFAGAIIVGMLIALYFL